MCMIEQEMKYRMDHAAAWFDELKKSIDDEIPE